MSPSVKPKHLPEKVGLDVDAKPRHGRDVEREREQDRKEPTRVRRIVESRTRPELGSSQLDSRDEPPEETRGTGKEPFAPQDSEDLRDGTSTAACGL